MTPLVTITGVPTSGHLTASHHQQVDKRKEHPFSSTQITVFVISFNNPEWLDISHESFCYLFMTPVILHCAWNKLHLFVCALIFFGGHSSCSFSVLRKVGFMLLKICTFHSCVLTYVYSVNGGCMTHSLHKHKLTAVALWSSRRLLWKTTQKWNLHKLHRPTQLQKLSSTDQITPASPV